MLLLALVQRATINWSTHMNMETLRGILNRLKTHLEKQLPLSDCKSTPVIFISLQKSLYLHDNGNLLFSGILVKHVKASWQHKMTKWKYDFSNFNAINFPDHSLFSACWLSIDEMWGVKCDNWKHNVRVLKIHPMFLLSSSSPQKPIQVRSITYLFCPWILNLDSFQNNK